MPSTGDPPNLVRGYRDLSIVHQGVGGVTYRGVHEESGAVVAVRVQRYGSYPPLDELAALERATRDDHLVTVLETSRTATGRRYAASPFCPGGDHGSGPPLPVREAAEIAVSVGRGLQALHAEGLIHGGVKPGRVLRDGRGPLLGGSATLRGLGAHRAPGVLKPVALERVDPGFAAPEALRRQEQTVASDVYGLGATLWGLLAGRAPFIADDRWAARERALNEPVPRVPRDDVPEWLADALAKAMASDPAERHPTVEAFTDALEVGLRGLNAPATIPVPVPAAGVPGDWQQPPGRSWEQPPSSAHPAPEQVEAQVKEHVPERERPASRRLGPVLATVVVLAAAGAGIVGTGMVSNSTTPEHRPLAERSPVPTSTPTAVRQATEYVPGRVRLVDGRISIEVFWQDRSGGKAAHYVVGGPAGRPPSTLASASPGTEKVVVTALNPSVDYCLTVVAVVDVDRVAHAEPVCTRRVKRKG